MKILFFLLIGLFFLVMALVIPINIAKYRGISASKLTTIRLLSWFGVLFGITYIVALILSICQKPDNSVNKLDVNQLSKLNDLRKDGIITEDEFNNRKQKLLHNDSEIASHKRNYLIAVIVGIIGIIFSGITIGYGITNDLNNASRYNNSSIYDFN